MTVENKSVTTHLDLRKTWPRGKTLDSTYYGCRTIYTKNSDHYCNCCHGKLYYPKSSKNSSDKLYNINRKIKSAARDGNIPKVLELFNSIFHKDLKPDSYTYRWLARGYANNNQPDEALGLYPNMISKGVKIDKRTMNVFINICAESFDLDFGIELFNNMNIKHGLKPNTVSYNSLLKVCMVTNSLGTAEHYFNRMGSNHITKDFITYNTMIAACKIAGNDEKAVVYASRMLEQNYYPNRSNLLYLRSISNIV